MTTGARSFLLVDDHALFRTGLGIMLAEHWPDVILRHASQWQEALTLAADESIARPDLVLLDILLPDGHGLNHLAQLQALLPDCPILLMSAQVDEARLAQAKAQGAAGLVSKVASASELVAAVNTALSHGQTFEMPSPLRRPEPVKVRNEAGEVIGAYQPGGKDELNANGITSKQLAILAFLGRSTPNKAIARQLNLSEHEVRAEVSWLTEKLDATSRQEAYDTAVARGWLNP